jgi:hypothetical protein
MRIYQVTQSLVAFTTTIILATPSARADTDDQKLKQALSKLAVTVDRMKASVEIIKGLEVFEKYCVACHGPEVPLPPLAKSPLMSEPNAALVKFILFPGSEKKHVSWRMALSPVDVSYLTNFLQLSFRDKPTELASTQLVDDVIREYHQGSKAECKASQ